MGATDNGNHDKEKDKEKELEMESTDVLRHSRRLLLPRLIKEGRKGGKGDDDVDVGVNQSLASLLAELRASTAFYLAQVYISIGGAIRPVAGKHISLFFSVFFSIFL